MEHLLPEIGKSDVKDGIDPNEGIEPMPKNDVVVGVDWVCGVLDSMREKKINFKFTHDVSRAKRYKGQR